MIVIMHTRRMFQFVIGLSKLDYKRDSYVDRQLRDIIANYLPRFNTVSTLRNVYVV